MVQPGVTRQDSLAVDREALASFVHAHRAQIKEAFRARFAAGDLGFYDSSDFFATVLRRADHLTCRLDTASHDIRRMLREIMLEALSDCARAARRERRFYRECRRSRLGRASQLSPAPRDPEHECEEVDRLHLSAEEMELVRLRASGMQHTKVAVAFGVSAAAIRMRWVRLVGKARASAGREL